MKMIRLILKHRTKLIFWIIASALLYWLHSRHILSVKSPESHEIVTSSGESRQIEASALSIVRQSTLIQHLATDTPVSSAPLTLHGVRSSLDNVVIGVKTTARYHLERVDLILRTWFEQAREQIFFFTDAEDAQFNSRTNGHMINTKCSATHARGDLCCKMAVEFDFFLGSNKGWFCHFDDDNYVNIDALARLLQLYRPNEDWYLGRPSLAHKLTVKDQNETVSFWFATGGAGFCISRGLALKMSPYVGGGKLEYVCGKIRLPDDCTIGYVVEHGFDEKNRVTEKCSRSCYDHYLNKELTVIDNLHSHLEQLYHIRAAALKDMITVSYSKFSTGRVNIVNVDGFNYTYDPTRFLSVHCYLYPDSRECQSLKEGGA